MLRSFCVISSATDEVALSADSAILMNAGTGEIIFEKNCHKQRGIASTTKIMTSVILLEKMDLATEVKVKSEDVKIEGTSVGLKADDIVTCDVLLKAMLLESGNDAANVTATAVSGSVEAFSVLMNEKAKSIGMNDTSFKNPSGLTEDDHFSTAYDMALLTRYAIKNPIFKSVCSLKQVRVSYGNPPYERTFTNHNKLLDSCEGVFGVKTGFTKASGRCLVSACERNGLTLIAVTLKAPDDWNDHKKLYDFGFEKSVKRIVKFDDSNIKVNVVGSKKQYVKAELLSELSYFSVKEIEAKTIVYCEQFLYADIKSGEVVGKVEVRDSFNNLICESYLVSKENAFLAFEPQDKPPSLLDKLKKVKG
jgi:D-alanyl-D-alanine carboxypeptidase/D-alanyl-D-alanine carboxypeptidase (penicillin-binding protein 5/6)